MEKFINPNQVPREEGSEQTKRRTFDPNDLNSLEWQNNINKTPEIDLFDILNEPIPKQATKKEVPPTPPPSQVVEPPKPKIPPPPPPPPTVEHPRVERPVYRTEEAKKQDLSQKTTINFTSVNIPPQSQYTWQGTSKQSLDAEAAKQAQVVWWILGIIFWIAIMKGCW